MLNKACFLIALPICAAQAAGAESDARYLAVFTNGQRVEGKQISEWHIHTAIPKLDSTNLADRNRPLRWLRDLTLTGYRPDVDSTGFVELVGGDRLPGRVVGFQQESPPASASSPGHLLVEPAVSVSFPTHSPRRHIRVLTSRVRRVVWGGNPRQRLQPGTLFDRDGSRFSFRSLRWGRDSVSLLANEGIRRVEFAEVSEIHLPRRDPWQAYYEQLAVLSPDGSARLLRLETADGLIATDSTARFRAAAAHGANQDRNHWYHMVQPVWSLDPLWLRFREIRTRWYFAAHEVPLCGVHPKRSVQRSLLSKGSHWQVDRNVQGGALHSGGQEHGWGFGVHASNELWFELPGPVRAFRSRVGLDRLAGSGGCARALVYVNQPGGRPLYQSPHLIGSRQIADTGTLSLSGPRGGQRSLVLVADSAYRDHPPQADPLDIRDMLDWIEPVLLLDPGKLRVEVQRAAARAVPAWNGWTASVEGGGPLRLESLWEEVDRNNPRYVVCPGLGNRSLTLSARQRLPATDPWLLIQVRQVVEGSHMDAIEVRVDGRPVAWLDVPPGGPEKPFQIPLRESQGRPVRIELVYKPGDDKKRIQWQSLALLNRPEAVRWVTLKPEGLRSSGSATLKMQPDGSVLVGGGLPANDVYTITAKTDLPKITALRLEALPDESLPGRGPGRADDGNFVLSRFGVGKAPASPQPLRGRYVRVDLPKPPLSLAEVQVISGDRNVAPGGKATQSSTQHDAPASLAVDDNTNGDFLNAKSVTHTSQEGDHANQPAWWEVDLGAVKQIDNIAIWNRTGGFEERLSNFRVSVLDTDRKPVWEKTVAKPPAPCIELDDFRATDVPLKSAAADYATENRPAQHALTGPSLMENGWAIGPRVGKAHVAVFTPEEPIDARGSVLILKLKHLSSQPKHALGRFRLSATGDEAPIAPELDPMVAPLPPE